MTTRTSASASTRSTTSATSAADRAPAGGALDARVSPLAYTVLMGRALLAGIFVMAGLGHFAQPVVEMAARQGVPLAGLAVPLSGVISLAGGLSVLLGYKARIGAWLLVLFLVPVTLAMHKFWTLTDPMMAQIDQAMFMKNLVLIGTALLIAHFGAGPVSLDARAHATRWRPTAR